MKQITFDGIYESWRATARNLLAAEVPPSEVELIEEGESQSSFLALDVAMPPSRQRLDVRVSREFLKTAAAVFCFRDREKSNLLYRILWRLTHGERSLLLVTVDPDVHRMFAMERAVGRDAHKMEAFVRFRLVKDELGSEDRYVAWFAPQHLIVERVAPFFAKRFASMSWSILTPDRTVSWDREELLFGPGVPRSSAPRDDDLDDLWRTYYASVFNPARIKLRTMQREMPKRYWQNLPEASMIPGLVADAPARVQRMILEARNKAR